MPIFLLLAALMLAAALAFVLVPLLRQGRPAAADAIATRRLRALDEALASGVIDREEFAAKRAALDHSDPGAPRASPTQSPRTAFVALLLVALLMPAAALLLYRLVGAPEALDPAKRVAASPADDREHGPDMAQAIALLAARLEKNPQDAEGWGLLGRAYQATERPEQALAAFRRAHEVAPENAAAAVEYAQALAMARPDRRIDGAARTLLEDVIRTDPRNQRALWLLGISDYQSRDYAAAITRWRSLLPLLDPASTVAASVKAQIADAEALRDGKTGAHPEVPAASGEAAASADGTDAPAATTASAASTRVATNAPAPKLTVNVALDPRLNDRLDRDATLFVFARAASGPPMPLAIRRLPASQLPVSVSLDDSMGMLPTMKLSMFARVVVGARISRSGNAMPQSGDLQVLSPPLDVQRRSPIALTIDEVVP